MQHDVVVIGAGIHGCATAWELARRGRQVTVLERSVPGAEASSAAGGILGPSLECDEPGPLYALCRRSLDLYPAWTQALTASSGVDVEFVRSGGLLVAFDAAEERRLALRAATLRALHLPHELWDAATLRQREPAIASGACAALHLPNEARVEPTALMRALTEACKAAGVRFVQDLVLGIEDAGGPDGAGALDAVSAAPNGAGARLLVRTATAELPARDVVLAAGAWSATVPGSGLPIDAVQPARGQMAVLRFPTPPLRAVVFSERGYLVPRDDGRVLCGSTLEFVGFAKEVTAAGMRAILAMAMELVPGAGDATIEAMWAGFRPFSRDHLPLIGPGARPGLWLATGHHRNGILLAPASAELLAAMVCGEAPPLDPRAFAVDRVA